MEYFVECDFCKGKFNLEIFSNHYDRCRFQNLLNPIDSFNDNENHKVNTINSLSQCDKCEKYVLSRNFRIHYKNCCEKILINSSSKKDINKLINFQNDDGILGIKIFFIFFL